MLNTLRHLLPDSTAWRLVVERTLKEYLRGIATVGSDVVAYTDDIFDDLWPDTTRELQEWLDQFGIVYWPESDDDDMRAYLDFRWGEDRGQSPKHLQDKLQAAGFSAYVYDSFDKTDVSLSKYSGNVFTGYRGQDSLSRGFCFASGGRKMYIAGDSNNSIYQYSLSSPYDLSTVSYDNVSFNTATEDTTPIDVQLNTDGTKMFVLGNVGDLVIEYDLYQPFLVNTANVVDSLDVTTEETDPQVFSWKPDGTIVYVTGNSSDDVHQYDLGTAWDISTASHTQSHDPSVVNPSGLTFTQDGAHMFLNEAGVGVCKQYDLSTPWDISTTGTLAHSFDMTNEDTSPIGIVLEHGHLFMYGIGDDSAYRYTYGGSRDPLDYADQPTSGTVQCGDDGSGRNPVAECGEEPPDQTSLDSAVCNAFLANEVWYLVNDVLTNEAPPKIPTAASQWGPFWYVGGTPFGTLFTVATHNRQRLEKLCLKHGPTEQWIVTMLDVGDFQEIGPYEYDDNTGTGADQDVRFNSTTLSIITHVRLGETDTDLVDHSTLLSGIVPGNVLRVALASNPAKYLQLEVEEYPASFTGYNRYRIDEAAPSGAWTGFPANGTSMTVSYDPIDTSGYTLISEWKYQTAGGDPASGAFRFTATHVGIHETDNGSTNQDAALGAIGNGDMLRFVRSDATAFGGSWIEYDVTGASVDNTTYWSVPMRDDTPVAQSPAWAGYPADQELMKIYHRESV